MVLISDLTLWVYLSLHLLGKQSVTNVLSPSELFLTCRNLSTRALKSLDSATEHKSNGAWYSALHKKSNS